MYSSSGRFHGSIQKSNASLSVRSENVRGDCAPARCGPNAIATSGERDARARERSLQSRSERKTDHLEEYRLVRPSARHPLTH